MKTGHRCRPYLSLSVLAVLLFAWVPLLAEVDEESLMRILGPQEPPFVPQHPIAIVGGTVIDATGAPPKLGHTVIIEGERITRVGPSESVDIPDGAQVIDAEGMTIMPGIINSNQHIQLNPLYPAPTADLPLDVLRARWEETFARMPHRAWVYLMQGVTSMRQTSGPSARILPVKKRIDSGELAGPRIFLGGALFMSRQHFEHYIEENNTPEDAVEWLRDEFAYNVLYDIEEGTDKYLGPEYNYWKLYMSDEEYDGENDFSDEELRYIIDKAHAHGKIIDVHAGPHNPGLRRMLDFDIDTLEHPFYGHVLIDEDVIQGYVDKNVIVDTLLRVMVTGAENFEDPHQFNETLFIMSMEPKEYRLLMRYRDKMLFNRKHPDQSGLPIYKSDRATLEGRSDGGDTFGISGPSYDMVQKRRAVSHENMRRFIRAGAKLSLGTDTPSFLNFQQEDPNATEYQQMVEEGLTPMDAVIAATRNGAEALGMADQLGTVEEGKLADVIVVSGNPLADLEALRRVYAVIKGGVRYK
ncbi:amidohydrolase family protein [Elongatibacter sediminis]|uniref:Amidohydrolase family protein n=1 Tax=Elongatibacter sediminis TaxID=3119006 RepID=A0AAW9R6D2_9GAMM